MQLKTEFDYDDYVQIQSSRSGLNQNSNTFFRDWKDAGIELNPKYYYLDIGCRSSAETVRDLWNKNCGHSYGIDIGKGNEEKWKHDHLKEADIHNGIPFDFKFDVITISHTLEHCYDPIKVRSIMIDGLNQNGYIHSIVPLESPSHFETHEPHLVRFEGHQEHKDFYSGLKLVYEKNKDSISVLILTKI